MKYRLLLGVLLAVAVLLTSGCDLLFGPSDEFDAFRTASLEEINFLRFDPAGYAEQRLLDDYQAGRDNGAYLDLLTRSAVGTLMLNSTLNVVATDYAQYLAQNDVFGHYEDGTPAERCQEAGYEYYSGENLAAGSYQVYDATLTPEEAAIAFVEMLVIDMDIVGVGHRENLLNDAHRVVGIGFHRDTSSQYKNYYVQDFGRL